jgi:flagellar motor switch protein FliM
MAANSLVTDEEISTLLEASAGSMGGGKEDKRRRVVPYDFRRPDRISKERVRSLYLMHDTFSHGLSTSLPIFLRTITEVTLISVEQQAYFEYLSGLPDPTVIFTLAMNPLQGSTVIEINPSIAFPIIDRMLGGTGNGLAAQRSVTEIEQRILEGFMKVILDDLHDAWKPMIDLDLQIIGRETRPQLLQIVPPNEVVIVITFHVQVSGVQGMMSLCIPAIVLEPIIHLFNPSSYSRNREVAPDQTRALLNNLSKMVFPVSVELRGTTLAMDDLFSLAPGDVLLLEHRIDQRVAVSVGGIVKFYGDLVDNDGHIAVLLRKLNSTSET